jgi:uncharacterized membrane protein
MRKHLKHHDRYEIHFVSSVESGCKHSDEEIEAAEMVDDLVQKLGPHAKIWVYDLKQGEKVYQHNLAN